MYSFDRILEAATGAQASLLKRLFRGVVQGGLVNLNADGTYSHTPLSAAHAKDEGDLATLFSYMFDEVMIMTGFPDYFKQRGAREPDGELAATHNPRTWFSGQEGKTKPGMAKSRADAHQERENI